MVHGLSNPLMELVKLFFVGPFLSVGSNGVMLEFIL